MSTEAPGRLASIRSIAVLSAAVLLAAGCGGTAPTASPAAPATGSPEPGACVEAPKPPPNLEGWSTAPAEPTVFPVIVNSGGSLTCGPSRLLFTFLNTSNEPVGSPDRTASVALYNLGRDPATPIQTAESTFVWGIEDVRGFYVAALTFPEAGEWGAVFTTAVDDGAPEEIRVRFQVQTSSPVVQIGDPAPATDTPTSASVGGDLARLSTDTDPDPAFYETSVKAALAAHDPFVLVFATPKFCASAQCGPTLDRVKALAADYPEVTFINVEPYVLEFRDGSLQPVLDTSVDPPTLTSAEPTIEWGILSEPWVFVVDRDGIVTGSFEGVIAASELDAAIEAVR